MLAEAKTKAEKLAEDRAAEVRKLAQARKTLEEQLAEQQQRSLTLEKSVSDIKERLKQQIAELNGKNETLSALEQELTEARASISSAKQAHEKRLNECRTALDQETEHRERLELQQATMKQELLRADAQITILTELWKNDD